MTNYIISCNFIKKLYKWFFLKNRNLGFLNRIKVIKIRTFQIQI